MEDYAYHQAERTPSDDWSIANVIEDNPIFSALTAYTHEWKPEQKEEMRATDWYIVLRRQVKYLDATIGKFPGKPSVLSKFLNDHPEILDGLGLEFTTLHTRKGSFWTFKRVTTVTIGDDIKILSSQRKAVRGMAAPLDPRKDLFWLLSPEGRRFQMAENARRFAKEKEDPQEPMAPAVSS